ncbi:unnamed protein product, partial [Cylicostephanus goldi]
AFQGHINHIIGDRPWKKAERVWVNEGKQRKGRKRGRPRKPLVQVITESEVPSLRQVQTKSRIVQPARRYGVAVELRQPYERKHIHSPKEVAGSHYVPAAGELAADLSMEIGHMVNFFLWKFYSFDC